MLPSSHNQEKHLLPVLRGVKFGTWDATLITIQYKRPKIKDWMIRWGGDVWLCRCYIDRADLTHIHYSRTRFDDNRGIAMTEHSKRLLTLLQGAAVGCALLWTGSALAREDDIEGAAPPPPSEAPWKFGIGLGINGTTDYISRGITQDDSKPAIQGYVEPSYGLGPNWGDAFVNVWSSNVDFGSGFEGAEVDVAGGLKPKFLGPKWSPQIGWVHYLYSGNISPEYGEVYGKTDYTFGEDDKYTLRALVFFAPDFSQTGKNATWVAGGARVKFWKNFAAYAGAGYQFFEDPNAFEQFAWTTGLSYYWKSLTFDVRYWDTNLSNNACVVRSGFSDGCDARVVGTISYDTTWADLFSRGSH